MPQGYNQPNPDCGTLCRNDKLSSTNKWDEKEEKGGGWRESTGYCLDPDWNKTTAKNIWRQLNKFECVLGVEFKNNCFARCGNAIGVV